MLRRLTKFAVLAPVHFYRLLVSPVIGPHCRFVPTCSDYALEAVHCHGAWVGLWLTFGRLSRCHPVKALGGSGGHDPVPVEIYCAAWYAPWTIKPTDFETKQK